MANQQLQNNLGRNQVNLFSHNNFGYIIVNVITQLVLKIQEFEYIYKIYYYSHNMGLRFFEENLSFMTFTNKNNVRNYMKLN